MWKKKTAPSKVLSKLLSAWDPRNREALTAIARVLRHHANLEEIAIYRVEGEWLILELTDTAAGDPSEAERPSVQTLERDSTDVSTFQPGAAPRLRIRELHQRPQATEEPYPGTVSVPLTLSAELVGLVVGRLREASAKTRALKTLEESAAVLAPALSVSRRLTEAENQLSKSERRVDAEQTAIGATMSLDRLLQALMAQCARAVGYDSAVIAGRAEQGVLRTRLAWRLPPAAESRDDYLERVLDIDEIAGAIIVTTAEASTLAEFDILSALAAPIAETRFVLALFTTSQPKKSTEEDVLTLRAYAEQLRLVLSREEKFEAFSVAYRDTLLTTVAAIELSRPELRGHHDRVTSLACALGESLELSAQSIDDLRRAGEVHDVGLLGGEDALVNTGLEFQHPELGASMISPLPGGERVGRIVQQHHESYDGYGFPDGLVGEQISAEGAVLGFAEFVVEHTTANAIAGAESLYDAARRVEQEAGHRFSPEVAELGAAILRKRSAEAFSGGDCVARKSCPQDLCSHCQASSSSRPCWELPAERRMCSRHGDPSCDGCFVWKTWGPGRERHG